MKKILSLSALFVLGLCHTAFATGPTSSGVQQVGSVTATHCATWAGKDGLADSGAPCGGSQTYPASGIAVSTGSSWGNSLQYGTSGAVLGFLNGNNTYSGTDTFTNPISGSVTGTALNITSTTLNSAVVNSSLTSAAGGAFGTGAYATIANYLTTASAASTYAPRASPTFTGTVSLPANQVVNGVTLTASGSSSSFLNAAGNYVASSSGIAIGTTTITGGVSGDLIYQNGTVPGNLALGNTLAISSSILSTQDAINLQGTATSYTVQSSDMGGTVTHASSSAVAVNLPQANTAGFLAKNSYSECNQGAGTVTITALGGSLINGSPTSTTTLALAQYQCGYFIADAANWNVFLGSLGTGGGGSGITALTGDVTASGSGSVAATVAAIKGTTVSSTTGTGNVVFSASPTLTGTTTVQALTTTANVTIGSNNTMSFSGHGVMSSPAASVIQIGPVDSAGAISETLQAYSIANTVSNTGAGNFSIGAGKGTGTGAGGSLILEVAPAGSSSSTQNALVAAVTIDSTKKSTFAGLIVLNSYTVATLPTGITGGMAYVTDATTCTYGGTLIGGSSTICKVFYNGTAWVGG